MYILTCHVLMFHLLTL